MTAAATTVSARTRTPLEEQLRTDEALGTDALELNSAITAFLHDAEERGTVAAAELEALHVEHDLDEEAVDAIRAALGAADVETIGLGKRAGIAVGSPEHGHDLFAGLD